MDERAIREEVRRIVGNLAAALASPMTQREWYVAISRVALAVIALCDRHYGISRNGNGNGPTLHK